MSESKQAAAKPNVAFACEQCRAGKRRVCWDTSLLLLFFFLLIHRYSATGLNLNAHYARNWERTVYIARKIESESKYLFIYLFFFFVLFLIR